LRSTDAGASSTASHPMRRTAGEVWARAATEGQITLLTDVRMNSLRFITITAQAIAPSHTTPAGSEGQSDSRNGDYECRRLGPRSAGLGTRWRLMSPSWRRRNAASRRFSSQRLTRRRVGFPVLSRRGGDAVPRADLREWGGHMLMECDDR
jgi:hypothetical protein